MSDPKAKPSFNSEEEIWAYIEEQEALVNKARDIFRRNPKQEDGLREAPASVREMEQLASDGDPIAQFNLSVAYSKGEGVTRNAETAARWLLEAAGNGFAPAQYNVGCYWRDKPDPDIESARAWFKRAAEQNFGPAQLNLGILYGNAGNYVAAYTWFYLAEQNRMDNAKPNREKAASFLTSEELNVARLAVSAWMLDFRGDGS